MPLGVLSSLLGTAASYLAKPDEGETELSNTKKKDTSALGEVSGPILDNTEEVAAFEEQKATEREASPVSPTGDIDFSKGFDFENMSESDTKALQKKIGASADGKWGPNSQSKLNKYYANEGINPPNAQKLEKVLKGMGAIIKAQPDNYYNIDGKRPAHKTNELSSGGDVSPELISSIETKLSKFKIPGLRITAGNDAYHQSDKYTGGKPSKSAHAKGNAIDFTTDDPDGLWRDMKAEGWHETYSTISGNKIPVLVSPDGKTRLLNEYAGKTAKTTGKHFDYSEGNWGYLLKRGKK